MTMISAMLLMTVTLIMLVGMVPRIHVAYLKAVELEQEQEYESLRELQVERNAWSLRYLVFGFTASLLVWIAKTSPGMEVPEPMAEAMAIYAASSLIFAELESLLAQRIARGLVGVPVRVKERD
jgi:hypothetical protein